LGKIRKKCHGLLRVLLRWKNQQKMGNTSVGVQGPAKMGRFKKIEKCEWLQVDSGSFWAECGGGDKGH
jgi:hypothetical protein